MKFKNIINKLTNKPEEIEIDLAHIDEALGLDKKSWMVGKILTKDGIKVCKIRKYDTYEKDLGDSLIALLDADTHVIEEADEIAEKFGKELNLEVTDLAFELIMGRM